MKTRSWSPSGSIERRVGRPARDPGLDVNLTMEMTGEIDCSGGECA